MAYVDGAVAGWCTVAPRADFKQLERSRKLAALDDQPVWSIPCFFVGKDFRRQGLMRALIEGAVVYARAHGATLIEAYPLDLDRQPLDGQRLTGDGGYTGVASAFRAAGFKVVKQASATQVMVRRAVRPAKR